MFISDSSDSQSDGTNSGSEEKPPANQSSIKITNNGHAMKIIVEGGNFNNGAGSGSKSVDADVLLNTEKAKPALLPRPPPSLTTPSILKFRGKHLQTFWQPATAVGRYNVSAERCRRNDAAP